MNPNEELFTGMLAEGLYVERRLTEVLPDLADQASDPSLAEMLRHHLEETQEQLANLEAIADGFDGGVKAQESEALNGLLQDAERAMSGIDDPTARDACLIASALKNEHMEVGFYEGMIVLAEGLEMPEAVELLRSNLEQERHTATELLNKERELSPA
jgi:ferritin-like metal-binding protein YciE